MCARVRACGGMGGRRNQRPGIYASSQGAPGTDQAFSHFDTRRGGTLGCRAADPIKRWSRGVRPGPRAPSPALLTLPRCLPRNRPAGTKCSGYLQRDPWARPTWKGAPWLRALWAGLQRQDLRTERMGRFSARSWLSWRRLSLSEAVEESSSSSFWEGVAQGEGRGTNEGKEEVHNYRKPWGDGEPASSVPAFSRRCLVRKRPAPPQPR